MKALDTSVLLALLDGEPSAAALLKRLRGVEVATTEANLLELGYLSIHGEGRARASRREALDRLRRKLTVLPIDSRAVDRAGTHLGKGGDRLAPLALAMFGALEAAGCDELYTRETYARIGKWKVKVTRLGNTHTKE